MYYLNNKPINVKKIIKFAEFQITPPLNIYFRFQEKHFYKLWL